MQIPVNLNCRRKPTDASTSKRSRGRDFWVVNGMFQWLQSLTVFEGKAFSKLDAAWGPTASSLQRMERTTLELILHPAPSNSAESDSKYSAYQGDLRLRMRR